MGILGSLIGGIAGAILGDNIGIAGFGNAINGSIPSAITGLIVGGLLEDKFLQNSAPKFPIAGSQVPVSNIKIRNLETRIIEQICQFRVARGFSILNIDDSLSMIARYKSLDMAKLGKVEANGGTYGDFSNMMNGFGYRADKAVIGLGNCYYGQYERLKGWMESERISNILLSNDFKKIGVGYVEENGCFTVILAN